MCLIIEKSQGKFYVTVLITSEKYQLLKKIQLKLDFLLSISKRQKSLIISYDKNNGENIILLYLVFPLVNWFSINK